MNQTATSPVEAAGTAPACDDEPVDHLRCRLLHDMQVPLTVLRLNALLLTHRAARASVSARAARQIHESTVRLSQALDDLMALELSGTPPAPGCCALSDCLAAMSFEELIEQVSRLQRPREPVVRPGTR